MYSFAHQLTHPYGKSLIH